MYAWLVAMRSSALLLIGIALVLPALTRFAVAQEDFSDLDFEAVYMDTTWQEPAHDREKLDLTVNVDDAAAESVAERRRALNIDPIDENDGRYVDWAKRDGNWALAPVMLGNKQDGAATPSDVAAPVGVELTREF